MMEAFAAAQGYDGAAPGRKLLTGVWQGALVVVFGVLLGLTVNHFRPAGLPLVAEWSMEKQVASIPTQENPVVDLEEATALYMTRGAVFIDAREAKFYRMGHVEGARNLPWEDFENRFPQIMADIPPDTLLITYCDGEACTLSRDLAVALVGKGYPHVRVLLNGWSVWQAANLPVERE